MEAPLSKVLFTVGWIFSGFLFAFFSLLFRGRAMESTVPLALLIAGGLLIAGLALFLMALLRWLPLARWIASIPTSRKLRSVALGLTELNGFVELFQPIVSPATGRECCLTRWKQQELVRSHNARGGSTTSWKTIASGFEATPFYLKDEEGCRIMVDPSRAQLDLPWETYYPDQMNEIISSTPDRKSFFRKEFFRMGGGIFSDVEGRVRYLESAIYPREYLYVLGEVRKRPGYEDIGVEVAGELAILRGDPEKLVDYDRNRDGQVDPVEWDRAVSEVEKRIRGKLEKQAALEPLATLVIAKPSVSRPFIIANRSEKDLLGRLCWKGYLGLIFGLGLIFFNLAGLSGHFFSQPTFGTKYFKVIKLIVAAMQRS